MFDTCQEDLYFDSNGREKTLYDAVEWMDWLDDGLQWIGPFSEHTPDSYAIDWDAWFSDIRDTGKSMWFDLERNPNIPVCVSVPNPEICWV